MVEDLPSVAVASLGVDFFSNKRQKLHRGESISIGVHKAADLIMSADGDISSL